jgi:hypothetical protein
MRPFRNFEHRPWLILPAVPHIERRYRGWDVALISALVFVVIGVFLMTMTPELGHAVSTNAPTQAAPATSGANHAD